MKCLLPLNAIVMMCFNDVPRGLGPWSMPHSFSFHWNQRGVQVSRLPLLYLHPSIVLLFTCQVIQRSSSLFTRAEAFSEFALLCRAACWELPKGQAILHAHK